MQSRGGVLVAIRRRMPHVKTVAATMAFVPALLPLLGCSRHMPIAVPVKAPETYPVHRDAGGLSMAAEPFDTDAKMQTFGSSNLPHRFTPILLVLENRESEKLHVHRSNAKLACADGTLLEAVSALAMYEQLRDDPSSSEFTLSSAHYTLLLENNDRKRTDWMAKEFPVETILTPGRRTAGFLYFRGRCRTPEGRKLQIRADKLTSPDALSLELDLR